MKTKRDGFKNAFEPYSQDEILLILSYIPTHRNLRLLARVLGRSPDAIGMVFEMAYSTKLLKQWYLETQAKGWDNLSGKIVKAKREMGMFLGYRKAAAK